MVVVLFFYEKNKFPVLMPVWCGGTYDAICPDMTSHECCAIK